MRGKNFTQSERDVIRLLLEKGNSIGQIGRVLGRSKAGVHGQIERMKRDGTIAQTIADLGQGGRNEQG